MQRSSGEPQRESVGSKSQEGAPGQRGIVEWTGSARISSVELEEPVRDWRSH